MKAVIKISTENPDNVIKSIEPDMDQTEKFDVRLEADENQIVLTVEAKDESGLLAGINSYVKLIKVSRGVFNE
jgi:tRNA threonylcarbamoyladenosine modification (KEOPS) complex  Pcc1 subunit